MIEGPIPPVEHKPDCDCFTMPCSYCNTIGEVIYFGDWVTCPDCYGSGIIREDADND